MKRINFKHNKYIIPVIALPFILLFYYISGSMFGGVKDGPITKAEGANLFPGQINPNMPGVSKEIASQQLKNKFDAYTDKFKNDKDYSAINGIQDSSIITKLGSNYTEADMLKMQNQRRLDSLQKMLRSGQSDLDKSIKNFGLRSGKPANSSIGKSSSEVPDQLLERFRKMQNENSEGKKSTPGNGNTYNDEMKAFREQMAYVDSMGKSNGKEGSDETATEKKKKKDTIDPDKDPYFIPLHVSSVPVKSAGTFNTLRDIHGDPDNIKAVIDQEGKVQMGTRIRIKLMQDMYIADKILPDGSYIYGMISGFQVSRINISITQIMVDKTPVPVKLDIYDNDGYLGLYVPGSNFREFSKEIGTTGTQGLSSISTSDNTDITTGIATKLFQTTTTSAAKLLSKDKAYLKYNYNVFLKERKTNNSSTTQK